MTTLTQLTPRTAAEALEACRDTVQPALRAAVDSLPPPVRFIAGYHLGWWDRTGRADASRPGPGAAAGRPGDSGGKALRPALALLAAEAVAGTAPSGVADPSDAVPAAVAVELVHNFSLLHDDVMDQDLTRRHQATAWRAFGIGPAILTGDSLLTLALDVLAAVDHPVSRPALRMIAATVQELIAGQSADVEFERRTDVDLSECCAMAEAKTGALLGTACALGALYGGANPSQVRRLRRFGAQLGLAFQHVDDLLGIWGEPGRTGKPVYADLRRRKKSLPVVAALASGTPEATELAGLYHRDTPLSDAELVRAAELVEAAGGREWSQRQAERLLESALRQLRAADPVPRAAAELGALARLVTERDH